LEEKEIGRVKVKNIVKSTGRDIVNNNVRRDRVANTQPHHTACNKCPIFYFLLPAGPKHRFGSDVKIFFTYEISAFYVMET